MKMFKLILVCLTLNLTPLSSCSDHSSTCLTTVLESQSTNSSMKKVYVSADQMTITEEGLFAYFLWSDEPVQVKFLSSDSNGLFVVLATNNPCGIGQGHCHIHPQWCPFCGGCGVLFCPNHCGC